MSEICLHQAEEPDTSMQCVMTVDEDGVKPLKKNSSDENQSVGTAMKEPEARNENVPEENKNVCTSIHAASNNSSPIKVKRRSGGRSKHRAGRNRKRRWRPYSKLSWVERKKLEERDARRAQRVRDEMSAYGLVLAPYNTTQFLMNDHNIQEPDYGHIHNGHKHKDSNQPGDSSDEYYSYSDDEDYINQQFMEDYESYHDQYLDSLTQEELVDQWVDLEDKIEALEKKLTNVRKERKLLGVGTLDSDAEMEKIQVFREEIRKITIENEDLEKRNRELENSLSGYS